MGRDKTLLRVGDETLVERVARALRARCDELVLAGALSAPPGVRSVPDARPGQGPLAGMEAGIEAASFPLVFVAAADMPFLSPELVGHLLRTLREREALAVVPDDGRTHPLCAAYSRGVLPHLRAALGDGARAAREFVRGLDTVVYVSGSDLRPFGDPDLLLMNVNSPEDLRRARELAGA